MYERSTFIASVDFLTVKGFVNYYCITILCTIEKPQYLFGMLFVVIESKNGEYFYYALQREAVSF